MALQVETASLVALFVETLLYGLFVMILMLSIYIINGRLRDSPETRAVTVKLSAVLALMFTLATVHAGTSLYRILDAFITPRALKAGERLDEINSPGYITQIFTYGLQTLIGDGFMIYRMYIVWDRRKAVCAPVALLFVANIGAGVTCIVRSTQQTNGDLSSPGRSYWAITFFWLTLITNTLATSLIAGRLLVIHRHIIALLQPANLQFLGKRSHTAAVVIVESSAVYSLSLIILIALYMNGTSMQIIVLNAMPQIMGIMFSLVILRVALGVSREGIRSQLDGGQITETPWAFLIRDLESTKIPSGNSMMSNGARGFISVEIVQKTDA